MKAKLAVVVGVAYVLMAASLAITPEWWLSMDWGSRWGLLGAAAIRVVVGLVLFLAAPTSKYPKTFRVLGAIVLVLGLLLPFLPLDLWAGLMQWNVEQASRFRWPVVTGAALFGAFIAYAALPRSAATIKANETPET